MLLLEVGGRDLNLFIYIFIGYGVMIKDLKINWLFEIEVDLIINNCIYIWFCGKVLGGFSVINGLIYICG